MNNLTQTQQLAKQAYLNRLQVRMFVHYQKADSNERKAIVKQIDSFLPVLIRYERIFWLKFRRKLEILNEQLK
jgi:hypothetical protein